MIYCAGKNAPKLLNVMVLALGLCIQSIAQHGDVLHNTIDLSRVNSVEVNLTESVEYIDWQGNVILIETFVRLENAKESYLVHFIEEGRYEVEEEIVDDKLTLSSRNADRHPIETKAGVIIEDIKTKLYYPQEFERSGHSLVRIEPLKPGERGASDKEPVVNK